MRKVILLLIYIIIFLITNNVFAKKYLSDGNGDWSDKQMWLPRDGPPAATDSVVIREIHTITISNPQECRIILISGILALNSQLTINGKFSDLGAGSISSISGSLVITGSGDGGILRFTNGSQILSNLTINRTSSGIVTLGSNLIVSGTLTLTNGLIVTGPNKITLGTGLSTLGTLVMPPFTSINSYVAGNFERWIPASTGAYNFPVGSATNYRPVSINFSAAPTTGGTLLITGSEENPGTKNTDYLTETIGGKIINTFCNIAKWQFTAGNGLAGGTYDLTIGANNLIGTSGTNYTEIRILKRPDSNSPWYLSGNHSAATNSNTFPLANRLGISDGFSEFGLGGNYDDGNFVDFPLPVILKSFTSIISGRDVKLNWITEKEINNRGYDVERIKSSESGAKGYEKIGFVESKGNINTATSYSFDDKNLVSGRYKYRLKQIDYNGNHEYFELNGEVTVGAPKKFDLSQNYPNPFNPLTKINFDIPEDGKVNLRIYDMLGREVVTLINEVRTAGYYTVNFDASKLSSGMYFYRLNAGNYSMIKKMAVIK